jgi:hypothetical protein
VIKICPEWFLVLTVRLVLALAAICACLIPTSVGGYLDFWSGVVYVFVICLFHDYMSPCQKFLADEGFTPLLLGYYEDPVKNK